MRPQCFPYWKSMEHLSKTYKEQRNSKPVHVHHERCLRSVKEWDRICTEEVSLHSSLEVDEISKEINQELQRGFQHILLMGHKQNEWGNTPGPPHSTSAYIPRYKFMKSARESSCMLLWLIRPVLYACGLLKWHRGVPLPPYDATSTFLGEMEIPSPPSQVRQGCHLQLLDKHSTTILQHTSRTMCMYICIYIFIYLLRT